jgi:hypothetical protein
VVETTVTVNVSVSVNVIENTVTVVEVSKVQVATGAFATKASY